MSASLIGPFGVKHFQTICRLNVDLARGSRFVSTAAEKPAKGRRNSLPLWDLNRAGFPGGSSI
jgi:hypothetical protein